MRIILFVAFLIFSALADCPRKQQANEVKPPAFEPEDHFIQSSFVHRDVTDDDKQYSIIVADTLRDLRKRLLSSAKITIDNENLDCSHGGFPRCKEFSPEKPYHFLVIEDSTTGAVVYSLDRERNGLDSRLVENALLDAFSRHSKHPLTGYVSESAEKFVGFVREVSIDELMEYAEENQAIQDAEKPTIFRRSPFELNLLNERIIELRKADQCERPVKGLTVYRSGELSPLIDLHNNDVIFCLFWTNVDTVSTHVYQLWKKLAQELSEDPKIKNRAIFAAVPCHRDLDLCSAFGIQHSDHRTVFALRGSRKFASNYGIGDLEFYKNWIKMVLSGTLNQVQDEETLKKIRKGLVDGFEEKELPRPAVTIGVFPEEDMDEFKNYRKISSILAGRYHFFYKIDENIPSPTVSTFRPSEKTKRIDYNGNFDVKSLTSHVTKESLPSLLEISRGFTSDVIYRSDRDVLLLIHEGDQKRLEEIQSLAYDKQQQKNYLFAHLNAVVSLPIIRLLRNLKVQSSELPVVCRFNRDTFGCLSLPDNQNIIHALDGIKDETLIDRKQPHPLKVFQLEHVDYVFGEQDVQLLAEPLISSGHGGFNHDAVDPSDGTGGCPMMKHLNSIGRDEL
ncbi:unnamed protein product [Bursaphelenchus xylophilus]|uniref:(pine wood nematode) hypothetical protein n=1 Tax=Bursaphelenchus xylophilus TaxID=6326 RepID=A0A1I7RZ26_BURXY|nr:unnamed protein product [Bursaphelenchus xylophilus]CAG9106923.1 unnamed protein product [Bursaphelenchus xylophilus]